MTPQPLYHPSDLTPAFALRYTWCGWITDGDLRALSEANWIELKETWGKDDLRLIGRKIDIDRILLTFRRLATESSSPATRGGSGFTVVGDDV